jgi:hypothetical protein
MKKGISIHIGLEYIDPAHYGSDGALRTCGKDALDMREIALTQNFSSTKLLMNEDANREAVTAAIRRASEELKSGDMLFISYSGHGAFVPDEGADEEDGKDETWCLFDGFFLDDELHALWTGFEEDVRIFMISDSCHSGTITKVAPGQDPDSVILSKNFPEEKATAVYLAHKSFYTEVKEKASELKNNEIKATIKLISGCQDDESSYVLPEDENSLLTVELNKTWDSGQFIGTTAEFFEKVKEGVTAQAKKNKIYQMPNYYTIGKENEAFDQQKPFGIYE